MASAANSVCAGFCRDCPGDDLSLRSQRSRQATGQRPARIGLPAALVLSAVM